MSIYTKAGDRGKTGLFGNQKRYLKNSPMIEVIGAVDEVNSYLGVAASLSKQSVLINKIEKIQRDLFTIGGVLAGADISLSSSLSLKVKKFEKEIDRLEGKLPVQKNFILPGGSKTAAHLFYARTLVRRAERQLVDLREKSKFHIPNSIFEYVNRLSDYLFILAREENRRAGVVEREWKGNK